MLEVYAGGGFRWLILESSGAHFSRFRLELSRAFAKSLSSPPRELRSGLNCWLLLVMRPHPQHFDCVIRV